MTISGDLTLNTIIGTVNLVVLSGLVLKGTALYGKFVKAWADLTSMQASHGRALEGIKATLGNGAPGTVVRVPTCERLHAVIEKEIGVVRDDIRELREIVIAK